MQSKKFEYYDKDILCKGLITFPDNINLPIPAVLICHDWSGRNDFAEKKAAELANLGYLGFAVDMYGDGLVGRSIEEKQSLMQPLMENRQLLKERITAAFNALSQLTTVNQEKIAVIGYCFGGLCALDLARSGANIRGAISFHGLLDQPDFDNADIIAKILVLHGFNDPMVSIQQLEAFEKEMSAAHVDWQTHVYSNTQHGFTNPLANDADRGILYNELAAKRAWNLAKLFLAEIFS